MSRVVVVATSPPRLAVFAGDASPRAVDVVATAPRALAVVSAAPRSIDVSIAPRALAVASHSPRTVFPMSYKLTRGDSKPDVDLTLKAGTPAVAQNLTGATAVLKMRPKSGTTVTTKTMTIVSAAAGTVRATWTAVETAALDETTYVGWVVVTFADLSVLTFPSEGVFTITVLDPATP